MDDVVLVPRCLLSVLFTVAAVHALRQVLRRPAPWGCRGRVDHLLHAAMGLAMAAMPWSRGGRLTAAAMTWFFLAAGLWFLVTADRPPGSRTPALAGRMPHAAGMAAMVWMLRTPHAGAGKTHEQPAGAFLPAGHFTAAGPAGAGPAVAVVLAVFLLGCALWSLTRPMPALRTAAGATRRAAAAEPYRHVRDGAMALGTAVMLLMPH